MSYGNLGNESAKKDTFIYCKELHCTDLTADTIDITSVHTEEGNFDTIKIVDPPTINNTNTHVLVRSSVDGTVELNEIMVTTTGTQTLTNKTLTTPIIPSIRNGGQNITVPSGIVSTFALQSAGPQVTDNVCTYQNTSPTPAVIQDSGIAIANVVTLAGTQTLTNKTLTSPIISTISNTGTLTLPTSTDTLVGRATTDTLTNKTLTSPIITGPTTPASAGAAGTAGTVVWASGFIYVCVATNTWQRVAIATW